MFSSLLFFHCCVVSVSHAITNKDSLLFKRLWCPISTDSELEVQRYDIRNTLKVDDPIIFEDKL